MLHISSFSLAYAVMHTAVLLGLGCTEEHAVFVQCLLHAVEEVGRNRHLELIAVASNVTCDADLPMSAPGKKGCKGRVSRRKLQIFGLLVSGELWPESVYLGLAGNRARTAQKCFYRKPVSLPR